MTFQKKSTTSPVTFNLRREDRKMVDKLSASKGISKSEVIREATRLYKIVNEQLISKKRLAFISEDGTIERLEVLWNSGNNDEQLDEIEVATAVMEACINMLSFGAGQGFSAEWAKQHIRDKGPKRLLDDGLDIIEELNNTLS
jgi:hypothetical protein